MVSASSHWRGSIHAKITFSDREKTAAGSPDQC